MALELWCEFTVIIYHWHCWSVSEAEEMDQLLKLLLQKAMSLTTSTYMKVLFGLSIIVCT